MNRSFTLFLLALLSLSAPAGASVIYVSGDQTGTWSADTVIVTAEVRVPPNMSLTILPGVEVLFSVYCKLIVDNGATLRAVGTPADSIRFDEYVSGNRWKGIRFLSASGNSRLEFCHLTHGWASGLGWDTHGGAIYCSSSSPTIQNCLIDSCTATDDGGGIYYCNNSNITISINTFRGNFAMNGGGISCDSSSNAMISGNTLSGNTASGYSGSGGGIRCWSSSTTISGNTISGNSASCNYGYGSSGGGISCAYSSPTISGNTISGNSVSGYYSSGGGISCHSSSNPTISGNTISGNSVSSNYSYGSYGGGISLAYFSSPTISGNTISGNSATGAGSAGGGISFAYSSSPSISGNTISGNLATGAGSAGGGIYCTNNSYPSINGNTISGNLAANGGGAYLTSAPTAFQLNEITENSASGSGGGLYVVGVNLTMNKNTIANNTASTGGGLYSTGSGTRTIINSILWGNSPQQISGTATVTYSDIQGSWTGTGNINANPVFVNVPQSDYRLQWGSPCIDSGDPNPIYNDPDGTRADMGAWYYDQSVSVRILLTPYNAPIQIPAIGGSFQYAIQATNIESANLSALVWCNVTLPDSSIYGPVLGPVTISLTSGQTLSRLRTQTVPAGAPSGTYHYNAYAVAAGDTSSDSFTFVKLGAGGWGLEAGGWSNAGEEFESPLLTTDSEKLRTYNLELRTSPNPFNPTTAISYQLSADSYISLRVYDTAGRLVTELVNGWREAGSHEVTFDGSGLPSGIYFTRLQAGDFAQTQKMILLK